MGGLEIDENYVVLGSVSEAIGGLNATGEFVRGVVLQEWSRSCGRPEWLCVIGLDFKTRQLC